MKTPRSLLATFCVVARRHVLVAVALLTGWHLFGQPAGMPAAELLDGEFGEIDLGRQLITPEKFPTIREFRQAVRQPEINTVLMFKLFAGDENHHLPVFSNSGRQLAFQRSDLKDGSSRILLFEKLDRAEPTLLSDVPTAYDYMFRWSVNSSQRPHFDETPEDYAFVRIGPGGNGTRIYVSTDGSKPQEKVIAGSARRLFPALHRRADGIWRLVYEERGRLMHEAFNDREVVDRPMMLSHATSPRWSRDGSRLLMIRSRPSQESGSGSEVVVRSLRTEDEVPLDAGGDAICRSPSWSPDDGRAAFYVRQPGQGKSWRIRVSAGDPSAEGRTLGNNVVVNPDFDSNGPAWEPGGGSIWFFSHEHQRRSYYPLVVGNVQSGEIAIVDYPTCCTTPNDLAINPANNVPEFAFVAHDGLPKDVFVLFLNHY